jgi:hypothetical protein
MTDLRAFHSAVDGTQAQNRDQQTAQESENNAGADDPSAKNANPRNQFAVQLNGAAAHDGLDLPTGGTEINN